MTQVAVVVLLTFMWTALWQDAGVGTILAGIVASIIVVLMDRRTRLTSWAAFPHPLHTLRFGVAFGWNLAKATAEVAWEVLTPTSYVQEGIAAVELETRSPAIITLVANAISVTPGTVTVDVDPPATLYIHVLHLRDLEAARSEVKRLEELAIRAFGPPDERERVAQRRAT